MPKAPLVREHIPLIVAISLLVTAITWTVGVTTAAYGMRDNAIKSVLQVVDKKLENYIPATIYYQKLQEKEEKDSARYLDLRSRIDQVLLKLK